MARKPSEIPQIERDLRKYATKKTYDLIRDVKQFAEIAEVPPQNTAAVIGALFMRLSGTLAVQMPLSKEAFIRYCEEIYDEAVKTELEQQEKDE